MVTPALLKALFVLAVVVGALLPLLAWSERRQARFVGGPPPAGREDVPGVGFLAFLEPVADLWRLLMRADPAPSGANRWLHLAAPAFVALPGLLVFGVIPFAGVYTLSGVEQSLVVSNPDWGILYVFMLGAVASYGALMSGWASNDSASLLGSLRSCAQSLSYGAGLGLSVVSILMVYGTLQLQDMVLAQDASFRVFALPDALGIPLPDFLLGAPFLLPAWGIFLQPLAFVLFFVCLLAQGRCAPFDSLVVESDLAAGYRPEDLRVRSGLFYLAQLVQVVVIAGLLTTLFFGGWSIPWVRTEVALAALSPVFGRGPATWLCIGTHFSAFVAKVLLLIGLQLAIRWTLPRLRYDQAMDLCWKGVLPLSLLNVFLTGLGVLLIGGEA